MINLRQLAAGLGARLLDDVANAAFLPVLQDRHQKVAAILEVPVETALRHFQSFRQNLDAQAGNALFGHDFDGSHDPTLTIELDPGFLGCVFHTG